VVRGTRTGLLAAAAVVTLLIGAALMASWLRAPGVPDSVARGPAADAGPVPTPDAGPVAVPTPTELARFATSAPPDALMVDFLFDPVIYADDVPRARAGLQMTAEGRYEEAVRELTGVYEADPMNGETATALGIALYLTGDDSARTEGLLRQGQALPLDDFANLAAWYLGNMYLRRGDLQQATRVLEALAQFPDDPGTRAQALLERLRGELR
jgi:hypothetical protein